MWPRWRSRSILKNEYFPPSSFDGGEGERELKVIVTKILSILIINTIIYESCFEKFMVKILTTIKYDSYYGMLKDLIDQDHKIWSKILIYLEVLVIDYDSGPLI